MQVPPAPDEVWATTSSVLSSFIGSEHADGALLGVALVLPRSTPPTERGLVLRALARFEAAHSAGGDEDAPILPLHLGSAGVLQ